MATPLTGDTFTDNSLVNTPSGITPESAGEGAPRSEAGGESWFGLALVPLTKLSEAVRLGARPQTVQVVQQGRVTTPGGFGEQRLVRQVSSLAYFSHRRPTGQIAVNAHEPQTVPGWPACRQAEGDTRSWRSSSVGSFGGAALSCPRVCCVLAADKRHHSGHCWHRLYLNGIGL